MTSKFFRTAMIVGVAAAAAVSISACKKPATETAASDAAALNAQSVIDVGSMR